MKNDDYFARKIQNYFEDFFSSWDYVKKVALKFIKEYKKDPTKKEYLIKISIEEKKKFYLNHRPSITMLKLALEEAGFKNNEPSLFKDEFKITIEQINNLIV